MRVDKADPQSSTVLRVEFDNDVLMDNEAYDPTNYAIDVRYGMVTPVYVKRVVQGPNAKSVDLHLRTHLRNLGAYSLRVVRVRDVNGVEVTP